MQIRIRMARMLFAEVVVSVDRHFHFPTRRSLGPLCALHGCEETFQEVWDRFLPLWYKGDDMSKQSTMGEEIG